MSNPWNPHHFAGTAVLPDLSTFERRSPPPPHPDTIRFLDSMSAASKTRDHLRAFSASHAKRLMQQTYLPSILSLEEHTASLVELTAHVRALLENRAKLTNYLTEPFTGEWVSVHRDEHASFVRALEQITLDISTATRTTALLSDLTSMPLDLSSKGIEALQKLDAAQAELVQRYTLLVQLVDKVEQS